MENSTFESMAVPLPEDILRLKCFGDFSGAADLIDDMLKKGIPSALAQRLRLEKEVMKLLPSQYPYSFQDALKIMQENVADFTEEELKKLQREGAADWILIHGKPYFQDRFFLCLAKTRKEITKRLLASGIQEEQKQSNALLNENMRIMKEKGWRGFHIHVKTGIKIKEHAIEEGRLLRVHLPLPKEAKQIKNLKIVKTEPEAQVIAPADALQRTAYFERIITKEASTFTTEYMFDNIMQYRTLVPEETAIPQPNFDTQQEAPHIVFTPYIKELCAEIIGKETNPLKKARSIYDFITKNVQYTFMREYFTVDSIAEYAAKNLKGDCGVQALLFITLCRCAGIPAKWQSGMYVTPHSISNHDWAQFYIAPYGWLFADCSFGGSALRQGFTERWDFYFGHLDPFRLPANSEFQKAFVPPKKWMRIDPYDNQRGEAEYEDRGLRPEDFEVIREHIEMKELE